MGLTNRILTKGVLKCPYCGDALLMYDGKPTDWESKDTPTRCQCFVVGEEMIIIEGNMEFVGRGEPKTKDEDGIESWGWSCCAFCRKCDNLIWADIIIKNGKINELANLRTNEEYEKERGWNSG